MISRKTNKKGLLLILSLLGFALLAVSLTENVKKDTTPAEYTADTPQVCQNCSSSIEQNVTQEEGSSVYEFDESQVVDVTEQVKGSKSGVQSLCDPAVNKVDLVRRVCSDNGVGLHHEVPKDGELVSGGGSIDTEKINSFKLTKVTYPLAFWLGKYVMATSNRQITKTDSAYSSNGEQIDPDYQLKTLSPQQSVEMTEALPATVRQPFEVTGRLEVNANTVQVPPKDGNYTVSNADSDPKCGCPTTVSTSDYNVGDSNLVSTFESKDGGDIGGYWRQQIPGGDNYDYGSKNTCIKTSEFEDVNVGLETACTTNALVSFVKGLFKTFSSFDVDKWDHCDEDGVQVCTTDEEGKETCHTERDTCVDPRNIVVMMTPIFGEVYECSKGICANSFLTYSYRGTLSPSQAEGKVETSSDLNSSLMYFLSTPCKADIEFDDGSFEMDVDVRCLWDASPTLFGYRLQAKDKAPNQEDFPQTYEEYWKGVEKAISDSAVKYGL
ncbi:MAG: hypothetical protein AB9915_01235 [Candidatus Dojkabacteria bacterium]